MTGQSWLLLAWCLEDAGLFLQGALHPHGAPLMLAARRGLLVLALGSAAFREELRTR